MATPTKMTKAKPISVQKIWFNQKFETPKGPNFLYDVGKFPGSVAVINEARTQFSITYNNGTTYNYSTIGTSWIE